MPTERESRIRLPNSVGLHQSILAYSEGMDVDMAGHKIMLPHNMAIE